MSNLVNFLLHRLDEDEATARAAFHDRVERGMMPAETDDGVWTRGKHGSDECRIEGVSMVIYDEGGHGPEEAEHIIRWHPARVLGEVEAKRRIVALHTGHHECVCIWPGSQSQSCVLVAEGYVFENDPTLCLLALPYADHPDYDEEWRA